MGFSIPDLFEPEVKGVVGDQGSTLTMPNYGEVNDWMGPALRRMVLGLTAEELYRTQPHLRTVVGFVARNVAHLGLKAYGRAGSDSRERLRDDPLAKLLKQPNASMTMYEVLDALASDLALYDRAYWLVGETTLTPSGWLIQPIPPAWVVNRHGGDWLAPAAYTVEFPNGERRRIDAENMLTFHGWNPGRPKDGTSPVHALKQVLAEQVQAWSYREQVWQNGGRVGSVLTRPKDAAWSDAARERFMRDWKDRWTGIDGKKAGGTPILEDGMELKQHRFAAREEEFAEVAKLSLATVAQVYYVNPVMVGILDNANFSNAREFRKSLYGETLGPTLEMIEDRLNTFLVPRVAQADGAYVEFNIEEKLQGDFETQGKLLSTSTGAPWMTRNEARALRNLPRIEGGDDLVTPLNVTLGGQASPQDGVTAGGGGASLASADDIAKRVTAASALIRSGFAPIAALEAVGLNAIEHLGLLPVTVQRPSEPERVDEAAEDALKGIEPGAKHRRRVVAAKAAVTNERAMLLESAFADFFEKQARTVLSRLGAKDPSWWDAERWDAELAEALDDLASTIADQIGHETATELGHDPQGYDTERTKAFLAAVVRSRASAVNKSTRDAIEAILAGEGPEGVTDPAHVFDVAKSARAATLAITLLTVLASFATVEAGKQLGATTKTWEVNSANPRKSHAALNGKTVAIHEKFPNGADWPGDHVLHVDEVAGCMCSVIITYG